MADQPRWPRGTPVAPGGKGPGGGRFRGHTARVSGDEAYDLAMALHPTHGLREDYTRRALIDALDMEDHAVAHLARDERGRPVGAISFSPYDLGIFSGEETPVTQIHHLGSVTGGGVGTALVWDAVAAAREAGHQAVYVEPIVESQPFYRRLGFTEDPLGLGVAEWGLPAEQFDEWLEEHDQRIDWAEQVSGRIAPRGLSDAEADDLAATLQYDDPAGLRSLVYDIKRDEDGLVLSGSFDHGGFSVGGWQVAIADDQAPRVALVRDIQIDQTHRGRGVAQRWVRRMEAALRRLGVERVTLQDESGGFWGAVGYTPGVGEFAEKLL